VASIIYLRNWKVLLGLIAVMLAWYASLLSLTRGAWLFLPVLIILILWIYKQKLSSLKVELKIITFLISIGLAVFVWQSDSFQTGFKRAVKDINTILSDPGKPSSFGTRVHLWRNSLIILGENPLLGTGLGDFNNDMKKIIEKGQSNYKNVLRHNHAHSIYFDSLAKTGVIGFSVMVGFYLLLPFWLFAKHINNSSNKHENCYAILGVVVVMAFSVFGLTEGLWMRNPFVNTYAICLSVLLAGLWNIKSKKQIIGN
jgi:O-antigen ligase